MTGRAYAHSLALLLVALSSTAVAQVQPPAIDEQNFVDKARGISLQVGKELKIVRPNAAQGAEAKQRGDYCDLFDVEWRARGSADDLANPVLGATAMPLEKNSPRTPVEYLAFSEKLSATRGNPFAGWPFAAGKKETIGGVEYAVTYALDEPLPDGKSDFARVYITIRNGEAI